MNGLWMVARREILVRGRTKGYLVGALVSALAVVVLALLPTLLNGPDTYTVGVAGTGAQEMSAALSSVKPAGGSMGGGDAQTTIEVKEYADEAAARRAVADGEVDAAVVNADTVLTDGVVDSELSLVIDTAYTRVATEKQIAAADLDPAKVRAALDVPPITQESVGQDAEDAGARLAIANIVVILLFLMLMYPTMFVAMGVIEEKSSRIVEILLATLRPWQLLGGKIIGLGFLGLLNMVVIVAAGLITASVTGVLPDLPDGTAGVIVSSLGWWILGYGFFAAMAGALGSLVSRQEDSNSTITPLTMLMIASYLVALLSASNPKSVLAGVLSYVPPFSSMMMPMRNASGLAPWWQQVISAVILAAAVAGVLAIGSRIYRRAVWRMGSRVKLMDALRG